MQGTEQALSVRVYTVQLGEIFCTAWDLLWKTNTNGHVGYVVLHDNYKISIGLLLANLHRR